MVTVEFSFADVDSVSGKRVGESLFEDLSDQSQTLISDVMGIPAGKWDEIIAGGVLASTLSHCRSMTYLFPRALLGGAR